MNQLLIWSSRRHAGSGEADKVCIPFQVLSLHGLAPQPVISLHVQTSAVVHEGADTISPFRHATNGSSKGLLVIPLFMAKSTYSHLFCSGKRPFNSLAGGTVPRHQRHLQAVYWPLSASEKAGMQCGSPVLCQQLDRSPRKGPIIFVASKYKITSA